MTESVAAEFTITRVFAASRDVIWRAWTDPEIAARWWHPHDAVIKPGSVRVDLREGGAYGYTMVDSDGAEYATGGTYLEVSEPEHLRFTWHAAGESEAQSPVITVQLGETEGGDTEMTFHIERLDTSRPEAAMVRGGWTEAFEELDGVLASGAAS